MITMSDEWDAEVAQIIIERYNVDIKTFKSWRDGPGSMVYRSMKMSPRYQKRPGEAADLFASLNSDWNVRTKETE